MFVPTQTPVRYGSTWNLGIYAEDCDKTVIDVSATHYINPILVIFFWRCE